MSTEVEETIKRIHSHKGVKGVLIMNSEGVPIRAVGMTPEETENYAALVSQVLQRSKLIFRWFLIHKFSCFVQLAIKAGGVVRTLDESDELAFLRIRSKKHEIMIAPDKDYILVVVQIPHDV